MNKVLIIKVPDGFSPKYIRREVNRLIEKIQQGQLIIEKECTHSEGCDMVKTKFVCLKEGNCDQ